MTRKGVHYAMGLFKGTKERKLLSHVYAVRETVSSTENGWKSPACHAVSTGHLSAVRAWVHDAQTVGPSCIPHNTWFPAISQSLF